MTNKYMFFKEQKFGGFDLDGFEKNDISIPKTDIHIYEFKCKQVQREEPYNDDDMAKLLDDLSKRLGQHYKEQFVIVNSESAQHFCSKLYPLVVDFETKLRYALYISMSLYDSGNVNVESFMLELGKESKAIEEADFGEIYQSLFTDSDFFAKIKDLSADKRKAMSKRDLIRTIQSFDESTLWQKMAGENYSYIEENFLDIKCFRNDVMHNHLIDFERYEKAIKMIKKANDTLDRAINDKLIANDSKYLNDVNIFEKLSVAYQIGVNPVFQQLSDLQAKYNANPALQQLMALQAEFNANPALQQLSALQAKLNANPTVQKYRAMQAELNAIAVSAAEKLANNNSENDLKGVSDKTTKPEADDNSPPTQQNEDGSLKEQDDKEDNPND